MSRKPIIWHTERRRIGDLVEWEQNPRKLSDDAEKQLAESIRRFGYVEEIVVNFDGRSIIGGHMRRRVALAHELLGPDTMVDVRIPSRSLTDKERDELAIRLNKNTGDWDLDMLNKAFAADDLEDWGFSREALGLEEPETVTPGLEESDEPVEVFDGDVRVKRGDVWAIGSRGSRVICGDATDKVTVARLLDGAPIDFVFTSPPYNVSINYSEHDDDTPLADYLAFLRSVVDAFLPCMPRGRCLAWNIGTSPKTAPHRHFVLMEDCGFVYNRLLIWKKMGVPLPNFQHTRNDPRARRLTPHFQHELVALFSLGPIEYGGPVEFDETLQADVFELAQMLATRDIPSEATAENKRGKGGLARHSLKVHPAAFPMRLPGSFIQHLADVHAVVYDPFMGSGTTLLAAEALGRIGTGCEIDPRYVEVILRRAERLKLEVKRLAAGA